MCNLEQLTTTDRVLLGQHVAVTAPTLREAREHVTRTAQELKATGHHVRHSISKVVLDNGGTLEALTQLGIRGRTLDHIVTIGEVDHDSILPAVAPTGGTISRR